MSLSTEIVAQLSCGDACPFASGPDPAGPTFGAGMYTIWHKDGRLIYVGMSGRGITAGTTQRKAPQGIYTRLRSHAVDAEAETSSSFMSPIGLSCRRYPKTT